MKQKITPEARYYLRFLKENKILRKYMKEFLKPNCIKHRGGTNFFEYISGIIKIRAKTHTTIPLLENIIKDSIDIYTSDYWFWREYICFIFFHSNTIDKQIERLSLNQPLYDYARNKKTKMWV